jgi:aminomethyltransferase
MAEQGRRTPLYEEHIAAGARMVSYAGWEMPIQYSGIKTEHLAVRESVGVFDVSHMGRVEVFGAGALALVQHWIPNDASTLEDGQSLYTPLCRPDGGIVDDCLVYRIKDGHFLIVINGANRQKDYEWFVSNVPSELADTTEITHPDKGDVHALLAVQGPKARALLQRLTDTPLADVSHNRIVGGTLAGIQDCLLACTGYTGEDGFEVFVPSERASALWQALMSEGAEDGIVPCGLGARDTLRLEMKYPLYGNDINDTTTPIEAGLSWTVKAGKGDFLGKDVLVEQMKSKPPRRLVGFVLEGRGVLRPGYKLWDAEGETEIGHVTSGGYAPSLEQSIGIGYVPSKPFYAKPGSSLTVEIRGRKLPVKVVKTPFHRKK